MVDNIHLAYSFSRRTTDWDSATVKNENTHQVRYSWVGVLAAALIHLISHNNYCGNSSPFLVAFLASWAQGLFMPLLLCASSQCQGFALPGMTENYLTSKILQSRQVKGDLKHTKTPELYTGSLWLYLDRWQCSFSMKSNLVRSLVSQKRVCVTTVTFSNSAITTVQNTISIACLYN